MVLKLISAKKRRIFPSAKALFPLAQHVVNAASQSILVNEPMLKIRRRVPLAPAAALGGARTARGAASEESTWEGGGVSEFKREIQLVADAGRRLHGVAYLLTRLSYIEQRTGRKRRGGRWCILNRRTDVLSRG